MLNYKRHYIWYNTIQYKWIIQIGYEVIASAATLGAAKCKVTNMLKKEA